MSDVFQSDTDRDFKYEAEPDKNLLHVGVSFSLLEMNKRLRDSGLFFPHGQCAHVHLGGHIQVNTGLHSP